MTEYERLILESLSYDPLTGIVTRHKRKNRWGYYQTEEISGTINHGYVITVFKKRHIANHRLAFLFMTGKLPDRSFDVDHINGKKDDNRWVNLRLATRSQNNINSGAPKNNTTGHKGVHPTRGRWFSRIKVNGKIIHLGVFKVFEDAVKARREAEIKYFGKFSKHETI